MLYDNGRSAEAVISYRKAAQLLPSSGADQDRLRPRAARHQQYRQRPRGGAQPRAGLAAGVRQLRPVAHDGRGLFQAEQSRHDLAGAGRDGGAARQQIRGGRPMPTPPRGSCRPARRPGSAPRTSRPISTRGQARPLVPEITVMRWLLLTVCGGLVLAGAVVAATATSPRRLAAAPAASAMTLTADQAALGKSIRAYLMANPEVLVDAMQELERKQDSQRDAVAQKGVSENQAELYPRPRQPDRRQSQRRRRHRRVQRLPVPLLQARLPGGEVGGGRRRQGEDHLQGHPDPGRGLEDRGPRRAGLGQAGQAPGAAQRADGIHRQARPRQDPRDRRSASASIAPSSRRTWKIPR